MRQFVPLVRLLRPELASIPHPMRAATVKAQFWSMFAHPEDLDPSVADVAADEFCRTYRTRAARVAFFAALRNIYLDEPHGHDGFWSRLVEPRAARAVRLGRRRQARPGELLAARRRGAAERRADRARGVRPRPAGRARRADEPADPRARRRGDPGAGGAARSGARGPRRADGRLARRRVGGASPGKIAAMADPATGADQAQTNGHGAKANGNGARQARDRATGLAGSPAARRARRRSSAPASSRPGRRPPAASSAGSRSAPSAR